MSDEELARAVRLDPSQFAGLGPSLDMLLALLLERKRKILEKYETDTVQERARRGYRQLGESIKPPRRFRDRFSRMEASLAASGSAMDELSLEDLDALWEEAKG